MFDYKNINHAWSVKSHEFNRDNFWGLSFSSIITISLTLLLYFHGIFGRFLFILYLFTICFLLLWWMEQSTRFARLRGMIFLFTMSLIKRNWLIISSYRVLKRARQWSHGDTSSSWRIVRKHQATAQCSSNPSDLFYFKEFTGNFQENVQCNTVEVII